jgi:molybdopterin synthase sulfur carrier subunit
MSAVHIPASLRSDAAGRSTVTARGATVGEAMETVATEYPGLRRRLFNDAGRLQAYVAIFVNSCDIRSLDGVDTPLREHDEVHIIGAIAGG